MMSDAFARTVFLCGSLLLSVNYRIALDASQQ